MTAPLLIPTLLGAKIRVARIDPVRGMSIQKPRAIHKQPSVLQEAPQ
ncbi:MAG: hypothetical protein IPL72_01525 [Sulfuritalea sp.]|nr:hypothetical protein [Sulfuritalea sp.]